ncbi:MAG: hypothetical protein ACLQBD_00685 [Syntrophobacteraceae bacterium]
MKAMPRTRAMTGGKTVIPEQANSSWHPLSSQTNPEKIIQMEEATSHNWKRSLRQFKSRKDIVCSLDERQCRLGESV